ncbi:MAG: glycosyltransferase family 4 protein [Bacteroidetes bacterium]|jgi:glycosyltransferase involved in cell wall biosynthesis|nr:glycosyltransferase family 4 protein [Bacteroidota bacterium]
MSFEPIYSYISEKNIQIINPVTPNDAVLDAALSSKNTVGEMNKVTDASKNVLQFLCFNSPYGGSFFQSLLMLEQKLNQDDIDMVYLFHMDTSHYDWIQELIKQGKKIYFLSGNFSKDTFYIRDLLVKHNIRYIHAHFAGLKYLFLLNVAGKLYSKQTFIVRHLRNHDKPRGFLGESLRKLLNKVDLYIGCSESVAIEYKRNFKIEDKKITHVTNAINFNRLNKFDNLKRADYKIGADTKVFLLFGFDYYRKGVDVVLEAMDRLVQEGHYVCLLLSLSTNKEVIESKIINRFSKIPDWLRILSPREDIASYYLLSNYFISASREEGFCNSLVEAAYCERPIISSDIPGQGSLNIPHTYKFTSENIAELKDAMIALMSLTDEQKDWIVSEQKEYVIKNFDLDTWAEQITDVYRSLN